MHRMACCKNKLNYLNTVTQDQLDSYLTPVREQLLHKMLRFFAVVGGVACAIATVEQLLLGDYLLLSYYLLLYNTFIGLVLYQRLNFNVKRALPLVTFGALLGIEYSYFGTTTLSFFIVYTLVVFTGLMFGSRYAFLCLFILFCIEGYIYWSDYLRDLGGQTQAKDHLEEILRWASPTLTKIVLISVTVTAISLMLRQLQSTLQEKNDLIHHLRRERGFKEQALDALKLSEEQFNRLFEHSQDAVIFITGKDAKIVLANSAAAALTVIPDNVLKEKTIFDIFPARDHALIRDIITRGESSPAREIEISRADGNNRIAEVSATTVEGGFLFLLFRDITDRKELEEQFAQSHKLEAIGQLASGIAHDFNNSLQVIIGFCELARFKMNGATGSEELEKIYESGKRTQKLVGQLLAFSRQQQLERKPLNLNVAVEESLGLVRRLIGENITLEFIPATDSTMIMGDRTQIEQVLLNLCINARDAIADNGTLTIKIAETQLSNSFCDRNPWASPGHFARLAVQDNGHGMTAETREKVFEPFFTTKEAGKGTGLGLSSVLGIVQQHEGFVHLESSLGDGTTLSVYLPLAR